MKTKWIVRFEENGGEYTGYVYITANEISQETPYVILADGVSIEFDEVIIEIVYHIFDNALKKLKIRE
jgi:hypothetical protein